MLYSLQYVNAVLGPDKVKSGATHANQGVTIAFRLGYTLANRSSESDLLQWTRATAAKGTRIFIAIHYAARLIGFWAKP